MAKILIIGGTSAIGAEVARLWANEGADLYVLGRSTEKLSRLADDLRVRGAAKVSTKTFDALRPQEHGADIEKAIADLGGLDFVLIAHGTLPAQPECAASWIETEAAITANFSSPIAFLTPIANYLESQKKGNITVISSVAGDRGRQSNYIYGSAKGGLTRFLEGLRNRLAPHGVTVTTVKPGFVDTPMTAHLPKGPLFASAEAVGARIHRAMKRGEDVVYAPWFWRFIMLVIQHIPEFIFKKLKL